MTNRYDCPRVYTVSPSCYHSRYIAMQIAVRHGINGNEELATQVVAGVTVGWDLMQQIALRLALDSPFQIVLYLNSTAAILSPVRTISSQMAPLDL